MAFRGLTLSAMIAGTACGGREAAVSGDTARAVAQPSSDTATSTQQAVGGAAAVEACPKTGAWTRCNLEDRLTHAGFVFTLRTDTVRHPFLAADGLVYDMARAEVQVFFYPDAQSRERDTRALDPHTVSPKGERVTWPAPPWLVTSNNLAAIILSQNPRLIERLQLALDAGLPIGEGR